MTEEKRPIAAPSMASCKMAQITGEEMLGQLWGSDAAQSVGTKHFVTDEHGWAYTFWQSFGRGKNHHKCYLNVRVDGIPLKIDGKPAGVAYRLYRGHPSEKMSNYRMVREGIST